MSKLMSFNSTNAAMVKLKTKGITAGLVISMVALSLSACSPSEGGADAPTETLDSKSIIEGYFSAVLSPSPNDIRGALVFSSAGSNAEAYAIYMSSYKQANQDGGLELDDSSETIFEGDMVLSCTPGFDEPDVDRDDYCVSFSNFEFEGDKLSNFHAGESSLEDRIVLGSEEFTAIEGVGEARLVAAYETISKDLAIVLELKSAMDDLSVPSYDAIYLTSEGRQTEVNSVEGPSSLKRDRVANVLYFFTDADIGGTLELEFFDTDYNDVFVSFPTQ
jgi:hypothetical protein